MNLLYLFSCFENKSTNLDDDSIIFKKIKSDFENE